MVDFLSPIDGNVLVLGLGREGLATCQFLQRRYPSCTILVADQREKLELPEELRISRYFLGADYLEGLEHCDLVVRSPGISRYHISLVAANERGVKITSATNLFLSHTKGRVVAVTGTKGKSTTSSLLSHLLKIGGISSRAVGNIGEPAIGELDPDGHLEDHRMTYVLELSSYQLEDAEGQVCAAIVTNLYPEHLDYHHSEALYYQAKLRILELLEPGAPLVYGSYSRELENRVRGIKKNLTLLATNPVVPVPCGRVRIVSGRIEIDHRVLIAEQEIRLIGEHNLNNAACAIEVAMQFGVPIESLLTALKSFEPLPHRLEKVGVFRGITFINDSISTTPQSAIAALRAVRPAVHTVILGGLNRGYQYRELAEEILVKGVQVVILFPDSGSAIRRELETAAEQPGESQSVCEERTDGQELVSSAKYPGEQSLPQIIEVTTMQEAVQTAFSLTPAESSCVLSPAAPSYNLFRDFEDRGGQFKKFVKELGSPDSIS